MHDLEWLGMLIIINDYGSDDIAKANYCMSLWYNLSELVWNLTESANPVEFSGISESPPGSVESP